MRRSKEEYDICKFCEEFWGLDKRLKCSTPCTCATYANQDYVPQREYTVGLVAPMGLRMPASLNFGSFWESLSEMEKRRISLIVGDLGLKDSQLMDMLNLLFTGTTKEEICEELGITEDTYYVYIQRLREVRNQH